MVILTLDTTTRGGSCAVWRGEGTVDELVGNPEYTHERRLPNDLAKVLANQRLRLKDVTLYAIASGPGSYTGLRVGIATMQSLALVHDRLIVPISSLEAMAYCGAREDPTHARPGAFVGAWMEAYRGEVYGALYRVREAPRLVESTDPLAGVPRPASVPTSVVPLPAQPAKTWMSLAVLDEILEPTVGTAPEMADAWARALTIDTVDAPEAAPTSGASAPSLIVIGDAVHAQRELLIARFPKASLLDAVPIAGVLAQLAAREPERGVEPDEVMPLYLRRPLAELARERLEAQLTAKAKAAKAAATAAASPERRRSTSGNGGTAGNGSNGTH